ncbi:MAG: TetR/AcrR family transcriptional regulator [Caulobacterales bacterium]
MPSKKSSTVSKTKLDTAETGTRAARKAAQPQRILAAALQAFGEKGFAATRMEDVAKHAGITKGAIYLYFPSKQALLEALIRRDISPAISVAAARLKQHQGPIEPALRLVLATAQKFLQGDVLPTYVRLIVAESGNFPDIARFHLREIVSVVIGALSDLFERAMARGDIRRMDPEIAARLFMAPIVKSVLWRVVFRAVEEKPFDPAPFLETHIGVFMRGMAPDAEPSK